MTDGLWTGGFNMFLSP